MEGEGEREREEGGIVCEIFSAEDVRRRNFGSVSKVSLSPFSLSASPSLPPSPSFSLCEFLFTLSRVTLLLLPSFPLSLFLSLSLSPSPFSLSPFLSLSLSPSCCTSVSEIFIAIRLSLSLIPILSLLSLSPSLLSLSLSRLSLSPFMSSFNSLSPAPAPANFANDSSLSLSLSRLLPIFGDLSAEKTNFFLADAEVDVEGVTTMGVSALADSGILRLLCISIASVEVVGSAEHKT